MTLTAKLQHFYRQTTAPKVRRSLKQDSCDSWCPGLPPAPPGVAQLQARRTSLPSSPPPLTWGSGGLGLSPPQAHPGRGCFFPLILTHAVSSPPRLTLAQASSLPKKQVPTYPAPAPEPPLCTPGPVLPCWGQVWTHLCRQWPLRASKGPCSVSSSWTEEGPNAGALAPASARQPAPSPAVLSPPGPHTVSSLPQGGAPWDRVET